MPISKSRKRNLKSPSPQRVYEKYLSTQQKYYSLNPNNQQLPKLERNKRVYEKQLRLNVTKEEKTLMKSKLQDLIIF